MSLSNGFSPTICLKRGNAKTIRATFLQSDAETPRNLTGWTAKFVVRDSAGTIAIEKENTSHTTPADGITDFELTADDTDIEPGKYDYAAEAYETADKDNTNVEGPTGTLEIIDDIVK